MFEHGIQHCQQFPHTGRQCDLGWFAGLTQSLVEGFQDTIMTRRHQRTHIEGGPHSRAATPDCPLSPEGAAVSIQGGDADQGRDLLVRQGSQLRQFRQQGSRDDGANAGDALQQLVMFPPDRAGLDRRGQVLIELRQVLLEPLDVLLNVSAHPARRTALPIFLRREHLDELAAPRNQGRQLLRTRIRQRAARGPHRFRKLGQDLGIEGIGLRQTPGGPSEVPHFSGFTTATGKPAVASAPLSNTSKPPVASRTIPAGDRVLMRWTTVVIPVSSYGTVKALPVGRSATSKRVFEISMPTKMAASVIRLLLVRWPVLA